jgi:hypothetical protein
MTTAYGVQSSDGLYSAIVSEMVGIIDDDTRLLLLRGKAAHVPALASIAGLGSILKASIESRACSGSFLGVDNRYFHLETQQGCVNRRLPR